MMSEKQFGSVFKFKPEDIKSFMGGKFPETEFPLIKYGQPLASMASNSVGEQLIERLKDVDKPCEVRGKDGNYIGFVPDTVKAFMDCGMHYYNEAVLLNPVGTAHLRAERYMKSKKLAKLHQNILVFKK